MLCKLWSILVWKIRGFFVFFFPPIKSNRIELCFCCCCCLPWVRSQATNIFDSRCYAFTERCSQPLPWRLTRSHPHGFRVSPLCPATSPRWPHVRLSDQGGGHGNAAVYSALPDCVTLGAWLVLLHYTSCENHNSLDISWDLSHVFCTSLCEVKIFLKPHGWRRWMQKWDPGLSPSASQGPSSKAQERAKGKWGKAGEAGVQKGLSRRFSNPQLQRPVNISTF